LCTLYVGLSVFAEKLNTQNCVNSIRNCLHYMYRMSGFAEKLETQNCSN